MWTLRGNIKGATGAQGIQGIQGVKGDKGDKGDTGSQGVQGVQGIQGIAGTNGKTWLSGTTAPATGLGVIGDFYVNTATWDVYEKTAVAVWTFRGNIKGVQGVQGIQGIQGVKGDKGDKGDTGIQGVQGVQGIQGIAGTNGKTWLSGTTAPATGLGVISDFYVNTATWDVYEKTAVAVWTFRGNIKGVQGVQGIQGIQGVKGDKGDKGDTGSQGVQGVQGIQGIAGTNGKTWLSGATAPATGLGVIGDFYVNTATWDVYEKTAAAVWTLRGNIKGVQGVQGIQGIQGVKGDKGDKGDTGSQGGQGVQGIQGIAGTNGKTWLSGTTAPATGLGVIGDFYVNTATWDVYEKTATAVWTLRGNIKGVQGVQGIQGIQGVPGTNGTNGTNGVDGKTILSGTANPTSGLGTVGDWYLNRTTWTMFEKTAATTWTNRGVIKGDTGAQGIQGVQGIQGIQGPQGPQGPAGLSTNRIYDPTDPVNNDYWAKININSVRPAFGFDVCNYEPQTQEYVSIFSNYGAPYLNEGILGSIALMCPHTGVPVIKGTVECQQNLNPYIDNNQIYFCLVYERDTSSPTYLTGSLQMLSIQDIVSHTGSGSVEMFNSIIVLGVATRDNTLMVQHREF